MSEREAAIGPSSRRRRCARVCFSLAIFLALPASGQEPGETVFGTTVVDISSLQGRVFHLEPRTFEIPDFAELEPVGTIYANSLNVEPQAFSVGFPGVTDRFQWFAIEYTGKIWIEQEGRYEFGLRSDDGSKLFIDGKRVIDNGGSHPPRSATASAKLTRGVHSLRVEYFQGPAQMVALVLGVKRPDESVWRVLDTRDFRPPPDPDEWVDGEISDVSWTRFAR